MAAKRIVVARESFACQYNGREIIVAQGTRLPDTSPIVKAHKDRFEPLERDDDELKAK